jgi:hypothetical protein
VTHGCDVVFQMAVIAIRHTMFAGIPRRIDRLGPACDVHK